MAGSKIGRHKLAPVVSPNKSKEGFGAGMVAAAITGVICFWGFGLTPHWLWGLLFGAIIAWVGLYGDLAESVLKRDAGVKDSSDLDPRSRWIPRPHRRAHLYFCRWLVPGARLRLLDLVSESDRASDRPRTGVALIGSTGSIGTQTLDVLSQFPDRFDLIAIAAGSNLDAARRAGRSLLSIAGGSQRT